MTADTQTETMPDIRPEGAIRNPDDPTHLVGVVPMRGRIEIRHGAQLLARSDRATRVIEIGRIFYRPTIYLPMGDVAVDLVPAARRTSCPLKGHTTYYDLETGVPRIAWAYTTTFPFADVLKDLVAFDPDHVAICEMPLPAPQEETRP